MSDRKTSDPAKKNLPLPANWPATVKTAMLQVIALAQYAVAYTRGWAANSPNARMRLTADKDRATTEAEQLRETNRIHRVRMALIDPHKRPKYPPPERMAILVLKTARGWSLEQTAREFLVAPQTIASWMKRLDEDGPKALVQLPGQPVNKFPDFVRIIVQQLKTLCPSMGKLKIVQTLARAGLHLAASTVGRMLKAGSSPAVPSPEPSPLPDQSSGGSDAEADSKGHVVTANYPGHIWHVDLTAVPTGPGLWCPWLPLALPQRWPFCFWVAVVVDHFSRRAMGATAMKQQPSSAAVRAFLGRAIRKAGEPPKYIVCDRGSQFDCQSFRDWCKAKGIKPPRYGAVGKHGSISVVERFILTLKDLLGCLLLVPYGRDALQRELDVIIDWYNTARPHSWLGGRTPDEAYYGRYAANRKPRYEPRAAWPRGSPCARPWALVRGKPGVRLELRVSYFKRRRYLPIVTLVPAA
jgi:putative transposase